MWALDNHTPYAADSTWVIDPDGAKRWVVAVKATFDIGTGGALRLSDAPAPPLPLPEYRGEPGVSSLLRARALSAATPCTASLRPRC